MLLRDIPGVPHGTLARRADATRCLPRRACPCTPCCRRAAAGPAAAASAIATPATPLLIQAVRCARSLALAAGIKAWLGSTATAAGVRGVGSQLKQGASLVAGAAGKLAAGGLRVVAGSADDFTIAAGRPGSADGGSDEEASAAVCLADDAWQQVRGWVEWVRGCTLRGINNVHAAWATASMLRPTCRLPARPFHACPPPGRGRAGGRGEPAGGG